MNAYPAERFGHPHDPPAPLFHIRPRTVCGDVIWTVYDPRDMTTHWFDTEGEARDYVTAALAEVAEANFHAATRDDLRTAWDARRPDDGRRG